MISRYYDLPDENDFYLSVVMDNVPYKVRFTWNEFGKFWKLSMFHSNGDVIVQGIKVVPNVTLNCMFATYDLPYCALFVDSKEQKVGRKDFVNGKAKFGYISVKENFGPYGLV